jgi:hypothetical protein
MRRKLRVIALIVLLGSIVTASPRASAAVPSWAPASRATIHPGVRTNTSGLHPCVTNFVFYDARDVYLGQEASCTGWLGALTEIEGATRLGTIVYNSRLTMGRVDEQDMGALVANNFALVRVHPADRGRVNPSVPFWGGPTGYPGRALFGTPVFSYGYSAALNKLSPRFGVDTTSSLMPTVPWGGFRPGRSNEGWTQYAHMLTPGMNGDSGGAVLDARGRAIGILNWWAHDAASRVTDLPKALAYMKAKTDLDAIRLAGGTTSFPVGR